MKISIIKNLTILLSFGLIVKLLGLFNKIILSRALEISGLAYYTKLLPIATLFMTIASFSLGPVITQIVSKNISKRPYSNRDLIKKSFVTATTTATIVSIIHLVLNYLICHYLLRMDILIKPFLYFIPLYYLQSYGGILKGYFHGHNKMDTYAIGQLLEQITRIILVICSKS
jgi:O-antigen/teichoic acid export membrane protein